MTPQFGREGSLEDQAAAIINSSDESLDDLMEGTEVDEGDEAFEQVEPEEFEESEDPLN